MLLASALGWFPAAWLISKVSFCAALADAPLLHWRSPFILPPIAPPLRHAQTATAAFFTFVGMLVFMASPIKTEFCKVRPQ